MFAAAGNCPRNTLIFPRCVTDGKLLNIFNTSGHTPFLDSIATASGTNKTTLPYTPSPPGSPISSKAHEGAAGTRGWQAAVVLPKSAGGIKNAAGRRAL